YDLDVEDERGLAGDRGRVAPPAVSQLRRHDDEPLVARPHDLEYLVPADDHLPAADPEGEGLLRVVALVEYLAVEEHARVVDHHDVSRRDHRARALLLYDVADARVGD